MKSFVEEDVELDFLQYSIGITLLTNSSVEEDLERVWQTRTRSAGTGSKELILVLLALAVKNTFSVEQSQMLS